MRQILNTNKFGPWALVTGASSGIGKEFARQLAQSGFNLVLVSRRSEVLDELGSQFSQEFGIEYKAIQADLGEKEAIQKIINGTTDLDIGLVISNAGTARPGNFLSKSMDDLLWIVQLNALSHLALAHHFGNRLAQRGRGGILITGAMGAIEGIPYMANEAGSKSLLQGLVKGLHGEFKKSGINLTLLITSPTDTPIAEVLNFTKESMPVKPLSVKQCVSESLEALNHNKMTILPGRKFRFMNALTPPSMSRKMMAKMLEKSLTESFITQLA